MLTESLFVKAGGALLVGLLVNVSVAAQTAQPQITDPVQDDVDPRLEAIDQWATDYVESGRLAGLVTLLAEDGEVVQTGAYGLRDLESGAPMTEDTLFRIFSMTKPVTSVAIMMLVDEGVVGLDDPVSRWLPELADLKVYETGDETSVVTTPARGPITVRQLLSHTAGLTYGVFGDHPVDRLYRSLEIFDGRASNAEMVTALSKLPLMFQPGERWHYSVATDVLGRIVEVASDQTLGEFFQTRIFTPLGMTDTMFFVGEGDLERLTTLYVRSPDDGTLVVEPEMARMGVAAPEFRLESGGAGLVSTAADYLLFCRMLAGGGALDDVRLLKPETVELMRTDLLTADQKVGRGKKADQFGFGLGFQVVLDRETASSRQVGTYSWGGYASTLFWIDPVDNRIAIVLAQLIPASTYPLRDEFEALVYGE